MFALLVLAPIATAVYLARRATPCGQDTSKSQQRAVGEPRRTDEKGTGKQALTALQPHDSYWWRMLASAWIIV